MRIPHRCARSDLLRRGSQALALILASASLQAQVIRDGSIGPAGGPLSGPNYQIPASLGQRAGGNLFHSFQKFDLQTGQSATFTAEGASNILARVTDRNPSSINGAINADANLFLMNPAGIVFHENATLNVTGSFFATTADYIKLGTSGRFSATTNPRDSVLSVSDPSAFGFLTPSRAALRVEGSTLGGPNLKTLGLIGGDVIVEGGAVLQAQDVQLVATRSTGEASLRLPDNTGLQRYATIDAESFAVHGSVSVGNATVPGQPPPTTTSINANRIVIRGGTLAIKNTFAMATAAHPGDGIAIKASDQLTVGDGSVLFSDNVGDVRGQPVIDIAAHTASVESGAFIFSFTEGTGAGGDLRMNIDGSLSVTGLSTIATESSSTQRGGDLHVTAGDMNLDNSSVLSQADTTTKSGDIVLNLTGSLLVTNGGLVQLGVQQASGERITINASDITISGPGSQLFFLDQFKGGIGGGIEVAASGQLSILDGGQIRATATNRAGASIGISAQNALISGTGAPAGSTGIFAKTIAGLGTRGGDIQMDIANLLQVVDGGAISSNTLDKGDGGSIVIRAHDMVVTGPVTPVDLDTFQPYGITAQNLPLAEGSLTGSSGSVTLTLSGHLEVRDGGLIAVDTIGLGRGGSIAITADSMSVSSGGLVTARTLAADNGGAGGDISINTSSELEVAPGGQITVATLGSGAGGSLSIQSGEVILHGQDALVSAVTGGPSLPATGPGGNIFVRAGLVQIEDGARINAGTLGPGAGGSISVSAGTLSISSSGVFTGISAQTLGSPVAGPGGTVQVDGQSVVMSGAGATITTQSFGAGVSGQVQLATDTLLMSDKSTIQSSSSGTGNAGSVAIDTSGAVSLDTGSTIQSSSTGSGNAGSVTIAAGGNITLTNGSSISVAATRADAGDISVRSARDITLTDSQITANASLNGGNIDVRSGDTLFLTNSQITAAAGINGGNIFLDPQFVILRDSLISANAILGRGGNIHIVADYFFSSDSLITASSEFGVDGTVRIDALNNDLIGDLVELPSNLLNAESLLRDLCTVKIDRFSSFISEGRGGLPPLPGEALPSLMIVR